MCGPSLSKVGQGILELLIGSEKVTDDQTDRPDRHVQSNIKKPFVIHTSLWSLLIWIYYNKCLRIHVSSASVVDWLRFLLQENQEPSLCVSAGISGKELALLDRLDSSISVAFWCRFFKYLPPKKPRTTTIEQITLCSAMKTTVQ